MRDTLTSQKAAIILVAIVLAILPACSFRQE